MNEIKIKVKFKKGLCYSQGINLVTNDYNSTKLVFEFDETEGTKIFEMKDPDDIVVFADEIVNNELILARFDGNNNAYPIFTKAGKYTYEVSLYKDNSKLTSAWDSIKVNAEQVIIDGEIVETYTPMFDNLLSDLAGALQEADNLDIDVSKSGNVATVTVTKKDGTEESVEINDGQNGANATINGVNTLSIEAGTNITLDQEGSTLTINSTGGGGGGTSDYTDLTNKPKINNVELVGNKSLSDLGIQAEGEYVTIDDLTEEIGVLFNEIETFYYNKTQTNNLLNNKQNTITTTNKLQSDLVDDTNQTNLFVTSTEKTTWNNKSEFSGNYNDLTNKPTIPTIPTNVSAFTNDAGYLTQHQDISGKANKISVVQSSASTIEINSNTFYKFGEVASLTITLASITDNTIYNEYMFEFVSGTTATTLTLPSSIKWLETPTLDANKIYQCSIVDNIGLLVGVDNV